MSRTQEPVIIQPEISLDRSEQRTILKNSNERVINSSVTIANYILQEKNVRHFPEWVVEYATGVVEDWEDIKQVDVKLFNAARNSLLLMQQEAEENKFRARQPKTKTTKGNCYE